MVYSTLGVDVECVNDIKFNCDFAKESLRFYKSEDVPKIETANVPKEASNVRFTSNLINSKHLETKIDLLLKQYSIEEI